MQVEVKKKGYDAYLLQVVQSITVYLVLGQFETRMFKASDYLNLVSFICGKKKVILFSPQS